MQLTNSSNSFAVKRWPPGNQPKASRAFVILPPCGLLLAMAVTCLPPLAAYAACPPSQVTNATTPNPWLMTAGDTCTDQVFSAGAGGIIIAPGVIVTTSGVLPAPLIAAEATGGGQINFSASSTITAGGAANGLEATGSGSLIDATGGTKITTTGAGTAIFMQNGGLVKIDNTTGIHVDATTAGGGIGILNTVVPPAMIGSGVTIHTDIVGDNAAGLALSTDSSATFDNLTVTGPGTGTAVSATANSTLTLTGTVNILSDAVDGTGLKASAGSVIQGDAHSVVNIEEKVGNDNSAGVYAYSDSQIIFPNGMNITVDATAAHSDAHGVYAMNPGSLIDARNNTQIIMNGPVNGTNNSSAVTMEDNGLVLLDSSTKINVNGPHDIGILLWDTQVPATVPGPILATTPTDITPGATPVIAPGVTVNLSGSDSIGLYATENIGNRTSSVTVDHFTVQGTGGAIGLAADFGSSITATNSTLILGDQTDSGAALYLGGYVPYYLGGATINFINSTATQLGANVAGASAVGGTIADPNKVDISGSTITSGTQADGIDASGAVLNVTIENGSQVTGGNGMLVQSLNASTVDLTETTGSTMTGAAFVDDGSTLNMTVSPTAQWIMTGNSVVTQTTNGGAITYTAPTGDPTLLSSYKTLTTGNYVGNGGVIGLNTYLGSDSSPSDRLVIDKGTATGTTALRISNTGGPGALTTSDGILVVDTINGATTAAGAFTLTDRVFAGPYEYNLFRGSSSNTDDWYLRSQPVEQTSTSTTPPSQPVYRPEVGAYLANQRLSGIFFEHSFHNRVGELQSIAQQPTDNSDASPKNAESYTSDYYGKSDNKPSAVWLRLVGKDISSSSANGAFGIDSNEYLLQGGGDIARWSFRDDDRDRFHLGLMAGYGWAASTVTAKDNPARADGDAQGVVVGVYGSWVQDKDTHLGWYIDTWGQYGWFTNRVQGQSLPMEKYDSRGWALSAETGYGKDKLLPSDWIIEPEAQLIYIGSSQDDFTEVNGTRIGGADNGWVSRLGVRMYRTWISSSGKRTEPFLTLNWWHDATNSAMSFDQISVGDLYPQDRYEVKVGVSLERGNGWSGWVNVGGQWGSQDYRAYLGRIGIKYSW